MVPLTDDFTYLKSRLDMMTTYAWTHIAVGVEFGFHMLSENDTLVDAASYDDEETKKFLVILTDGAQTEPAFGPGSTRTVAQGEANLEALCTNAKAKGITVITIAYDLDDNATTNRLKNCATDPNRISSSQPIRQPLPALLTTSRPSSRQRFSSANKSFVNESL